jgi:hypothetical protein
VLAVGFGPGRIRLVPHLGIRAQDIETVLTALHEFPQAPA